MLTAKEALAHDCLLGSAHTAVQLTGQERTLSRSSTCIHEPMANLPFALCREIEGGRLVVHVVRDLRNKQARVEKLEAKTGKYVAPKVHFKELKQLFRNISDTTIRYRLRDKCECLPVKVSRPMPFLILPPPPPASHPCSAPTCPVTFPLPPPDLSPCLYPLPRAPSCL